MDADLVMPLDRRPAFARKMIAVWRLHHLAAGKELTVTVWPGEWPEGEPREIKGVPVVEDDRIGGSNAIMILGQVRGVWRAAYNLCVAWYVNFTVEDVAITTAFMEVGDDPEMKVWLHPDPGTGEVPMWAVPKKVGF